MSNSKTVLVTGGAGFIGSHVVDKLVRESYNVIVLDNLSNGRLSNIQGHVLSGRVEFIKGDIRDISLVKKTLKDVDVVVHLAALISVQQSVADPESTFDVNVGGTLNILRSSAEQGVDKLVFASSCAVYGDPEILPVSESSLLKPISPYAQSKLYAERYCSGFSSRELLQTVIFRFFNVYGQRQSLNDYSGVITRFFDCIKQRKPLMVHGDGSQTRDFINVADIAGSISASIKKKNINGEILNLGSGIPTSIKNLAELLLALAESDLPINHCASRHGDIKYSYADITKAKALLDFIPTVSLKDGLSTLFKALSRELNG